MFLKKIFLLFLICNLQFAICNFSFSQGTWTQKTNVFSSGRAGVVGFSIGTKGYFGTGWQFGSNNKYYNDFWEWDQPTNAWTQKANFPGIKRGDAVGFSIGNFGYIGTGTDSTGNVNKDFWEWNQATNTWIQKANFSGAPRAFAIGFSIGTKGYIGTGGLLPGLSDFWEWDQATNTWTQKANFGGGNRTNAVGFSVGAKGYVGTSGGMNDFWEYDPSLNSWTQKANLLGAARNWSSGFSIGTKGYIGTGADNSGNVFDDFYEWDQATNVWTQKANYPHQVSDVDKAAFSIGCHGYFGCGSDSPTNVGIFYNDFWEYTPDNLSPINATISNNSTICNGNSASLSASGGINYSWSTGASTSSINVSPSSTTTYSVIVSTDCGSDSVSTTVTVANSASASFSFEYDPCKNSCVQFVNQSLNSFSWNWDFGDGNNSALQNPCHSYNDSSVYNVSLVINQSTGCADTFSTQMQYKMHDTTAFVFVPNAFSPNNDGSNDVLQFFRKDFFCIKDFEIVIYDRWGEKVFETNNINDSWDGTFHGNPINSSVFVYYCKTTTQSGVRENKKGNISIIR